jgi:hypothetical protein
MRQKLIVGNWKMFTTAATACQSTANCFEMLDDSEVKSAGLNPIPLKRLISHSLLITCDYHDARLEEAVTTMPIKASPDRRAFPADWKLNLKKRPRGRMVYLRRSNGNSEMTLLGKTWPLGQAWPNRLVRCEVDLDKDKIRFFTLRRKEPASQTKILGVDYRLPSRGFQD